MIGQAAIRRGPLSFAARLVEAWCDRVRWRQLLRWQIGRRIRIISLPRRGETEAKGQAPQTADKRRTISITFSLAVLVLAFGIRIWNLGGQSFWWDEAYSIELARKSLPAIVTELRDFDFHPPLYYLTLRYWARLAGESEFALRLLSVFAGVLAVAVAIATGRRMFRHGVATGLVFAGAPFLVYYSQETRMYSLASLWTVLALYCFVRALVHTRSGESATSPPHPELGESRRTPPSPRPEGARATASTGWRWWLLLGATFALGLYTYYYFVFVPVALGVLVLLWPDRWRLVPRYATSGAVALVAFLPWLPILVGRTQVWSSDWASVQSPLRTLAWTWPALVVGLPEMALYERAPFAIVLAAALGVVALAATRLRHAGDRQAVALALTASVLPLVAMALVSAVRPVYHPRYAMPAAAGLYLAFAAAASHPRPTLRIASSAAIAFAFIAGLAAIFFDPAYLREDYRAAVTFLEEQVAEGDVVLYNAPPAFNYYYRGVAPASYFGPTPYDEETVAAELNRLAAGRAHLWYFTHNLVPTDPEGIAERLLADHLPTPVERWFGTLRVRGYTLPAGVQFDVAALRPTAARFEDQLQLTGYRLADAVVSGQATPLALAWEVIATPETNYGVGIQLVDANGTVWGRHDHRPRNQARVLSSSWQPGERFTTQHEVVSLVGTPPGEYFVEAIVYRLDDLRELDVRDLAGQPIGTVRHRLATVRVDPPSQPPPSSQIDLATRSEAEVAPGLILVGYDLGPNAIAPGSTISLTALWRAVRPLDANYELVIAGFTSDGSVLLSSASPLGGVGYPTSRWPANGLVRSQVSATIPADAPPGPVEVRVGVARPGDPPELWETVGTVEIREIQRNFEVPDGITSVGATLGGEIRLLGYTIDPVEPDAGATWKVTVYWQPGRTPSRGYHVFVHLADANLRPVSQRDGVPVDWTHPTSGWLPGEVVEDSYEIAIPEDLPAGSYTLLVGMYEPGTGTRLPATGATGEELGDFVPLRTLTIQ